ncbi:hypothetical protein FRC08_005446, partial [Ceratobasidium sp. 394]
IARPHAYRLEPVYFGYNYTHTCYTTASSTAGQRNLDYHLLSSLGPPSSSTLAFLSDGRDAGN